MQATVKWGKEEAQIKESMAFEVAEAVEQHITVGELAVMRSFPGRIQYAKLSKGYAALLEVVGIAATPQEVHKEFTKTLKSSKVAGPDRLAYAIQVMDWLLMVLMDGAPEAEKEDEEELKKEGDSGGN